jgi:two-component system NtrC family sensor kinase
VPTLFVIRGEDQGSRFELTGERVTLGRDPANTIRLRDPEMSRRHAEIRRDGEDYWLVDLGSSNGTFVNGRRISQHRLVNGDQIQIGGSLLLFTQPIEESRTYGPQRVSIVPAGEEERKSRIVRSIRPEEGSQIFRWPSESPDPATLLRAHRNLQIMYRAALAASLTTDIDQLLRRILDLIFESVEADRGCILLVDPETKQLEPRARRVRAPATDDQMVISRTVLDYVLQHNEGVLTTDARQDERWDPGASIVQAGIREVICVPMQGRYGIVGAIYIDRFTPPHRALEQGATPTFTEEHLKLMVALAHQAALAVEDTRYYSALVQAERLAAVGQTVATISHHIKNILQGIRGGSYLIELGLAEHNEELIQKGWKIVEKNQQRISSLVMDMLTFSKEREPELVPADLNRVVEEVIELMQSRAAELGVRLLWEPQPDIPQLVFDPEGIHRAVLNVVTNAIDAAAERAGEGWVGVRTQLREDEGKVAVIVEDNGPGITREEMRTIFSPFVSSKGSRGTGLGLPVSQKILQEHDGRILVESAPGQGAKFILEWPVNYPANPQEPMTSSS